VRQLGVQLPNYPITKLQNWILPMAKDKKNKKGGSQPEEQRAPQVARHSAKETPRL
jgi:hypothetical protein